VGSGKWGDGERERKPGVGVGRWKMRSQKYEIINTMSFKFEKLIIWQKAMDWGEEIYSLSGQFPRSEMYNLTSQIHRASDSIALNIAEGSILQSNKEFSKFLSYAVRSIAEVVTCLYKAVRRKYLSENEFQKNYQEAFNLMNMVIAFRKKLQ